MSLKLISLNDFEAAIKILGGENHSRAR